MGGGYGDGQGAMSGTSSPAAPMLWVCSPSGLAFSPATAHPGSTLPSPDPALTRPCPHPTLPCTPPHPGPHAPVPPRPPQVRPLQGPGPHLREAGQALCQG